MEKLNDIIKKKQIKTDSKILKKILKTSLKKLLTNLFRPYNVMDYLQNKIDEKILLEQIMNMYPRTLFRSLEQNKTYGEFLKRTPMNRNIYVGMDDSTWTINYGLSVEHEFPLLIDVTNLNDQTNKFIRINTSTFNYGSTLLFYNDILFEKYEQFVLYKHNYIEKIFLSENIREHIQTNENKQVINLIREELVKNAIHISYSGGRNNNSVSPKHYSMNEIIDKIHDFDIIANNIFKELQISKNGYLNFIKSITGIENIYLGEPIINSIVYKIVNDKKIILDKQMCYLYQAQLNFTLPYNISTINENNHMQILQSKHSLVMETIKLVSPMLNLIFNFPFYDFFNKNTSHVKYPKSRIRMGSLSSMFSIYDYSSIYTKKSNCFGNRINTLPSEFSKKYYKKIVENLGSYVSNRNMDPSIKDGLYGTKGNKMGCEYRVNTMFQIKWKVC